MGMLDQLDLDAVKRLYRADLPVPVDVLNLIHFKDEEAYKWYGVVALPLLKAVGAEIGWMGTHVKSFLGEPRAEELLVVRYPNQRRFFARLVGVAEIGSSGHSCLGYLTRSSRRTSE